MKIKRINSILYCDKWQQTVAFYKRVLHCPVSMENEWFVEFKVAPGACLSVADAAHTSMQSSGGQGLTISLQVEDAARARQELLEMGFEPTEVRSLWGADVVYVWDPEGHRLEFWSEGEGEEG